jgi:hypothetical protein
MAGIEEVSAVDGLLTVMTDPDRGRDVNRALMDVGVIAHEISPKRNTLESLFLELTEIEAV